MPTKFNQARNFALTCGKQVEIENKVKNFILQRRVNNLNTNYLMLYAKNIIKKNEAESIIELNKWAFRGIHRGYLTRLSELLTTKSIEQSIKLRPKDMVLLLNFKEKEFINPEIDLSGYGNDCLFNLTPMFERPKGVLGGGAFFDGKTRYGEISINDSLKPANFTFMCWVRPPWQAPKDEGIAGHGGVWAGFSYGWRILRWGVSAKLTVQINFGDPGPITIEAEGVLGRDKWTHLALSYDHEYIRVFINGTKIKEVAETRNINYHPTEPMMLGINKDWFFDGLMDEVVMYNRALSESEILEIYRSEKF